MQETPPNYGTGSTPERIFTVAVIALKMAKDVDGSPAYNCAGAERQVA